MIPTTGDFDQRRRQRLLDEGYFHWIVATLEESIDFWSHNLPANGTEAERKSNAALDCAYDRFCLLLARYTGGDAIEPLRDELEHVVAAYEAFAPLRRLVHEDPDFPPFLFRELDECEVAFQLIGLCYLLHRRDLLPRIAAMQDPFYRGQDTLYEDLLAYELEGRYDVDKWFHDKPYRDLINSFYRDTDEECINDLSRYLDSWYSAMKKTPWHDGHLNQTDKGGTYVGYWAIEAAAATFLLELDDSSYREHLLYPKDLVDFARSFEAGHGAGDSANRLSLRCEAGEACPKSGYWMTPAKAGSRRYFQQGEVMPTVTSDYGSTIWQWDNDQSDPKL
ncbi:hypothetical protein CJO74_14250 [Ralstonia solanacearum]|nr:hypothetical protein CJO74_14250 [Ralstonia solanacearum]